MEKAICEAIEEFRMLVKSLPSTEAADAVSRAAASKPNSVSIPALARLYVLTEARKKHEK